MSENTEPKQDDALASDISPLLAEEKAHSNQLAKEICEMTDALGYPCEMDNNHERAMERIRDRVAMEGELGDCKELLKKFWEKIPDTVGNGRIYSELKRLEIIS